MRNAAGQLSHRLHFLGLQQRRLGLLSRLDFGTEPFVSGGELTSSLCHGALELFAVARQRCSRIAQLVADLVELTHSADQRTDGLASSQSLRGGRQRLDRPPDAASHPPAQEEARRKDRCTPAQSQQSCTADRSVDKLPRPGPSPIASTYMTWPSRKPGIPTTRIGRRRTAPRIRSEIWG